MPKFMTVAEAVAYYRRASVSQRELEAVVSPPVDAFGEDVHDTYLASIFAQLVGLETSTARLLRLNEAIAAQARAIDRLRQEGNLSASAATMALREALVRWHDQIAEAALHGDPA